MNRSMNQRIIAVSGATGGQGSGVVAALLNDTSERWLVRAITRDPSSARAQKLLNELQTSDGRLSVIHGNPYDPESLRKAFSGAYGVFAVQCELLPDRVLMKEEEIAHELEAGRNIVDAARHCSVEHFVFGSMPDMTKATSGRYTRMDHMSNKFKSEQYARKQLEHVTFLIPGFFYTNLTWPQYAQRQADGVVRFCAPIPGTQTTQWLDASYDVGQFAARVFSLGKKKTKGKIYPVLGPKMTMDEMASIFTSVTGQPAVHSPLPLEKWTDMTADMIGPAFREDVKQMMEWVAIAPKEKICWGAFDAEEDSSLEELGVTATTFAEWLERTGWTGPKADVS